MFDRGFVIESANDTGDLVNVIVETDSQGMSSSLRASGHPRKPSGQVRQELMIFRGGTSSRLVGVLRGHSRAVPAFVCSPLTDFVFLCFALMDFVFCTDRRTVRVEC